MLLALASMQSASAYAQSQGNQAVRLVMDLYKRHGKTVSSLPIECVSFSQTPRNESEIEVTLREIHNARCGGDVQTSPRIATFYVKVFVEDWQTGALKEFSAK
jgi:hypothetical protein